MEEFPKSPHPTVHELAQAKRVHQEADPTTYSALPPEELAPLGSVHALGEDREHLNEKHASEDDEWYELDDGENPQRQQLAVRLLKGIVNVSDIVWKDGRFYSKRLPTERIGEQLSPDEIMADHEIINLILGDGDHSLVDKRRPGQGNNTELKDGTAAYFDFGSAFFSDFGDLGALRELSPAGLERFTRKLDEIEARFAGAEGRAFAEAVYDDFERMDRRAKHFSNMPAFDEFYRVLLERIDMARAYAREWEAEQSHKRAA